MHADDETALERVKNIFLSSPALLKPYTFNKFTFIALIKLCNKVCGETIKILFNSHEEFLKCCIISDPLERHYDDSCWK